MSLLKFFDSLAAVSWSENDAAQSVIAQVFHGLSNYFSDPSQRTCRAEIFAMHLVYWLHCQMMIVMRLSSVLLECI